MNRISEISLPQRQALKTYVKLMRTTTSVTDRLHRHLRGDGLTISQFGVLEALHHLGPLCQRDIGNKILKTGGNMTLVIDNLEKRDLVERVKDIQDRRYLQIHLTSQGHELVQKVFLRHAGIAEKAFALLDQEEQEQLGMLLKKLGRSVSNGPEQ